MLETQKNKKNKAEQELKDLENKIANLKNSSEELEKFRKELDSIQERSDKLNRDYSQTKFSYDEMLKKKTNLIKKRLITANVAVRLKSLRLISRKNRKNLTLCAKILPNQKLRTICYALMQLSLNLKSRN